LWLCPPGTTPRSFPPPPSWAHLERSKDPAPAKLPPEPPENVLTATPPAHSISYLLTSIS
jgi:hypothetical protein